MIQWWFIYKICQPSGFNWLPWTSTENSHWEKLLEINLNQKTLTVCSYHVTYTFQSESTLYSYLNVKELLACSKCKIWSLSDYDRTQTHNHLAHKRTLNHLAKLAKWLSCAVSTYLYSAFDGMFLSCQVCISE